MSTEDLRGQIQQLVSARLPADHAVWNAVRRHPALVARLRGILSGLAASAGGTKDEHMQKVWIAAARTALDTPTEPKAPRQAPEPVEQEPVEEPLPLEAPAPAVPQAPRTAIPAMVFQEPQ